MNKRRVQPVSDVVDPCVECGVSTGTAGSYYSDRTIVAGPGGTVAFLCSDCRSMARGLGRPTVDPLEPRGNLQVAIPTHTPLLG
jgi:hypothetical protein